MDPPGKKREMWKNGGILDCNMQLYSMYLKAEFDNCRCEKGISWLQLTPAPCEN